MAMNMLFSRKIILLSILVLSPLHSVMAGSFSDTLRVMGISVAPSGVKSPASIFRGNLWLSKIDEGDYETKPITRDGAYHSPLWIPGSNKILAVKDNKLVQLDINGSEEKVLYPLADSTILHGFDKRDAKSVLILQNLAPAVLSLANGKITLLPYDGKNKEDRDALDRLMGTSRSRDYGNMQVLIKKQKRKGAGGSFKEFNKIHIEVDKRVTVIPCPADCRQPALTEDGRQLVFVGP